MTFFKNVVPYDLENLLRVASDLFEAARLDNITPHQFSKLLTDRGITGPEKIMYIHETFGMPLEDSKRVWLDADYEGGEDQYCEDLGMAIDDASKELHGGKVPKDDSEIP